MLTVTKTDLEEIKDTAKRLYRDFTGSMYFGNQLDRDYYLLQALSVFLIKRGVNPTFEIEERK